jgi:6-pyruvoyltetrahydropterin/6-carboxytetrahydropterin synthase
MIHVTKVVEWDMGHRVPNHKSKCRNPHGHRYRLELTVGGPLVEKPGDSSEGMVYDFGDLKGLMMTRVHDVLDHGFMVYQGDQVLTSFFKSCEDQDFRVLVVPFIPTAENLTQWCYEQLQPALPAGLSIFRVRLFETPNSWADYGPGAGM